MTAHVRQQIRDAIVAALAGLPTTAPRVYAGRTRPLEKGHAPTLLVYTTPADSGGQEAVRPLSVANPRTLARTMQVSITGHVQTGEPCDDLLDTIAAEVETALAAHAPRLGGLTKDITLQSTISQVDAVGERHEGAIRLIYAVTYHTSEGAPTAAT